MYKIFYSGAKDGHMCMVHAVYKKTKFLFLEYYKICTKKENGKLFYAEFDTYQEATDFINKETNK